jgi:hypothetical protein
MPKDAYIVERLVIAVEDQPRMEPTQESGVSRLHMTLSFKNPVGSPGSTRRPPSMEIWDAAGRTFPVENDDWAQPVLEDTEINVPVVFLVAENAEEMELVLAPGEPEETHVPLDLA